MDPIITPALFLLGLLAIHSKTSGNPGGLGNAAVPTPQVGAQEPEPEGEIVFSGEWRTAALDVRASKSGALVQHFKPQLRQAIERGLSNLSLEQVAIEGDDTGALVFRVVPGAGDLSVAKAIAIGRSKGLAVLATLPLTLPDTTAERFVMLCKPSGLDMAARGTNLAVLADPTPALAPKTHPASAVGSHNFDTRAADNRTTQPNQDPAFGGAGVRAGIQPTVPPDPIRVAINAPPDPTRVAMPVEVVAVPAKPEKKKRVYKKRDKKTSAVPAVLNGMNHTASKAEESETSNELPVV